MMERIDVSKIDFARGDAANLIAEASALGFKPGEWPDSIAVEGREDLGEFVRSRLVLVRGGDLVAVEYTTATAILHVLND